MENNNILVEIGDKFGVSTVSSNNSKVWEELIKYREQLDKDVMLTLDFKDVALIAPWLNSKFKKLISMGKVSVIVYGNTNKKIVTSINAVSLLNGGNGNTASLVKDTVKEVVKVNKLLEKHIKIINSIVEIEGDKATIVTVKSYNQIESRNTIYAIKQITEDLIKKGVKMVTIDVTGTIVQEDVVSEFINYVERYNDSNEIEINMISDDDRLKSSMEMYMGRLMGKKLSQVEKIDKVKKELKENTVVMLTKYKDGKKVDKFGRYAKGERIWVKPAIFKGYRIEDDTVILKWRVYSLDTFKSKLDMLSDFGECPKEIKYEDIQVCVDDIGLFGLFTGRRYHATMPIQNNDNTSKNTGVYENNRRSKTIRVSLPYYIKLVLDSWGIEYNISAISNCIIISDRNLEENKNK